MLLYVLSKLPERPINHMQGKKIQGARISLVEKAVVLLKGLIAAAIT